MSKKVLFLKGMLMGIADLIPGISGGTIAFITGIYERLIFSIKNLQINFIYFFLNYLLYRKNTDFIKAKKSFFSIDFEFLLPLVAGIGTILLIGSHVISYLLDNYFTYIMSFFVGLIVCSVLLMKKHIKKHGIEELIFLLLGIVLGLAIFLFAPSSTPQSLWFIFLSGFLAISALFLPGISGSYILLILGKYDVILSAIKNPFSSFSVLFFFSLGAIIGVILISRLISYLLKNFHSVTLYALIGLVLGTIVVPIKNILAYQPFSTYQLLSLFFLFLLGLLLPYTLEKIIKKV